MTFRCNPELRAIIGASPDKLNWAVDMNTAMGNTRRIRCFRDANPTAVDPFTTGVEFRNVGSTGAFTTKAGALVKLGRINGTTVSSAADMSTGRSILRVEGNGHWFEGTLGLSREAQLANGVAEANLIDYDFTVDGNFTANNGLGVKSNITISGPRFLPSGTGTPVPALTANAPYRVELWDYRNSAAPALVGTQNLTTRDDNIVFEDADIAAEIGDVGVYYTPANIAFDEFEFGFTMFVSDKHNRIDYATATEPLYEVLGAARVKESVWNGYPLRDAFNPATHVTIPPAFKVIIKTAGGTILHIMQWADGSAINSERTYPGTRTDTKALRPNWNVGMMLPWRNSPPRLSSRINKWYPGMVDDAKRPTRGKASFTVNGVEVLITGGYQGNNYNGIHNLWGQAERPQPRIHISHTPPDPYYPFEWTMSGNQSEFGPWADGWGYEPGSYSGHNWYTGPGGPRFDRAPIPSLLALYASNPTGSRPAGNVPWATMYEASSLAYANHSNHWVRDPSRLHLADNTDLLTNWHCSSNYYGDPGYKTTDKVIDMRATFREGDGPQHYDKNGQLFWSGWGRDTLHSYGSANWAAIATNSPMMAVLGKFDTFWQLQALDGINYGEWKGGFNQAGHFRGSFMVRDQAWLWLHYTLAWKMASTHRLSFNRDTIEAKFVRHLEDIHASIYMPIMVNNEQSAYAASIRNLGQPFADDTGETKGGFLGMYMAGVLALMKQTGLWSKMKAKGGKVKTMLEFQLQCMDKYCFDYTLDSAMTDQPSGYLNPYKSWGENRPINGQGNLWYAPDGSWTGDRDVGSHPFSMYPYVRRDYFPEYPNPRLQPTIDKFEAMFATTRSRVAAAVAAGDPTVARDADHAYGYPGVAIWKAPAPGDLGPA
jgi:hypothetical protein